MLPNTNKQTKKRRILYLCVVNKHSHTYLIYAKMNWFCWAVKMRGEVRREINETMKKKKENSLKNKEEMRKKWKLFHMYTHVYLMFINVHHHRNKTYKATHKYCYMMCLHCYWIFYHQHQIYVKLISKIVRCSPFVSFPFFLLFHFDRTYLFYVCWCIENLIKIGNMKEFQHKQHSSIYWTKKNTQIQSRWNE